MDNSHRLVQKIASLYANQLLSDITLIVENKHYSAHRLILCASSDVFQVSVLLYYKMVTLDENFFLEYYITL